MKQDLYRYEGDRCDNLLTQLRYILFTPSYRFIYCFRNAMYGCTALSRAWFKVLHRLTMWKYGIQIPVGTEIGKGFRISHYGTIVVNPQTKIGDNFTICQGCLIGNAVGRMAGTPTIGNEVYMGGNSIIVGGVHIGDRVLIAPGAFVNFDVPSDSVVIGNPGVIHHKADATRPYNIYLVK